MTSLPPSLAISPRNPLDATLRVPGSKSLTNRALPIAALADGESRIEGALASDDTRVMRNALVALGARIECDGDVFTVSGTGGRLVAPDAPLAVESSGTSARFLTATATLAPGPVTLDGSPRMRERPIEDLVRALAELGAEVEIRGADGGLPVRVRGGGLPGGEATIDARLSSQFVSAVLLAAPYARKDVTLAFLHGELVSRPYVELTIGAMRAFGAEVAWAGAGALRVAAGHPYRARSYVVEPDASAAAYPFCAAAIAGGKVRVEGIPAESAQADFALLDALAQMGCQVVRGPGYAEVRGPADRLRGIEIDMNAMPDAVLALAVVALFAEGPTRIHNVANLRLKETDRLAALESELRRLGAGARAGADSLIVEPGTLHGAEIATYGDHRMAMAFALAGLRVPGVLILEPGCVSKTWPDYFDMLEGL